MKLNIDQVEAGMVTVKEVRGMDGRVLLAGGVALTERHMTMLRAWGVTVVDVAGDAELETANSADEENSRIDEKRMKRCEEKVRDIFSRVEKDRFTREMMRAAVEILYRWNPGG